MYTRNLRTFAFRADVLLDDSSRTKVFVLIRLCSNNPPCLDWTPSKDAKEPNKFDAPANINPKLITEQIEERLWKLLTNKAARDIGYDHLEVTVPKAPKGKPIKSAVTEAMKR